jgi:hypothetical protein
MSVGKCDQRTCTAKVMLVGLQSALDTLTAAGKFDVPPVHDIATGAGVHGLPLPETLIFDPPALCTTAPLPSNTIKSVADPFKDMYACGASNQPQTGSVHAGAGATSAAHLQCTTWAHTWEW